MQGKHTIESTMVCKMAVTDNCMHASDTNQYAPSQQYHPTPWAQPPLSPTWYQLYMFCIQLMKIFRSECLVYIRSHDFCGIHCSEGRWQEKKERQPSLNPRPTRYHGASATSYRSKLQIIHLPSLLVPVAGVPLSSDRLGPTPQSWYCVMWW